jgi:hypothetical protein
MATKLIKQVHRETAFCYRNKPVIITLAPCGGNDAFIAFRLKHQRLQYLVTVSDVYRMAAFAHGNKERLARMKARKEGVPWSKARKQFLNDNSITPSQKNL